MKSFLKQNWFKIGVLTSLFILVFTVAYYLFIFIPEEQQKARVEEAVKSEHEQFINSSLLNNCIEKAESDAERQIEQYMESIVGTHTSSETIQWSAEQIQNRLLGEKEECYQKYN